MTKIKESIEEAFSIINISHPNILNIINKMTSIVAICVTKVNIPESLSLSSEREAIGEIIKL